MVTIKWELDVDGKRIGNTLSIEGCNPRHSEERDFDRRTSLLKIVLAENLEHLTGEKGPRHLGVRKLYADSGKQAFVDGQPVR